MARNEKYKGSAERIRSAAKALGLNQSSLSREVGVARSTVNSWWRGQYRPEGDNLAKLAEVLMVAPAHIAGLEKTPDINPAQVSILLASAKATIEQLSQFVEALESVSVRVSQGHQTDKPGEWSDLRTPTNENDGHEQTT